MNVCSFWKMQTHLRYAFTYDFMVSFKRMLFFIMAGYNSATDHCSRTVLFFRSVTDQCSSKMNFRSVHASSVQKKEIVNIL